LADGRHGSRGGFVTFEGVEGAGKSTRCNRLVRRLESEGIPVLHTREPGGPPVSERIRKILLEPGLQVPPRAELLLYLASRAANVDLMIRPALEKGVNVVSERFSDATLAYQVGGRGLPVEPVRRADALATGGLVPDMVILLDLPPGAGLSRMQRQGRELDRIEMEKPEFHEKVRNMYLELSAGDPRYLVVDATLEPSLQDEIIEREVLKLFQSVGRDGVR